MKVTRLQKEKLISYFAFTVFFKTLPEHISECSSREEIQIGSIDAYHNDPILHGRVDITVNAVIKIMEDDQ